MVLPPLKISRARTQLVSQVRPINLTGAFRDLERTGRIAQNVAEEQKNLARSKYLTGVAPDIRRQLTDLSLEHLDDPQAFV